MRKISFQNLIMLSASVPKSKSIKEKEDKKEGKTLMEIFNNGK